MEAAELRKGMLVQLNPDTVKNKAFAACIMVVDEPKDSGCMGYVQVIGEARDRPGGQVNYLASWEEIEVVGEAIWLVVP
jgi:hypothetical protein